MSVVLYEYSIMSSIMCVVLYECSIICVVYECSII